MAVRRPSKLRTLFRCALLASIALGFANSIDTCPAQDSPVSQWSITNSSVALSQNGSEESQSMQMVVNTSRELTADKPFKRVRIQNPNVLSALPLEGGNRLQISAIQTGVTQVDLVGADDSVFTVQVMVLGDVRELETLLRQQFPTANLQVTPVQKGCIISGFVTSDEHIDDIMKIAELYFPTVINRTSVTGVNTIQLETQVMEVSRTKLRELGIDWAFGNGDDVLSSSVSGLIGNVDPFTANSSATLVWGVAENSTRFFNAIHALRQNNLVKVLANPTLTAVDGRPASFNAGGEIPIVVPSGLGQNTVQYREFGTRVDYVAKIRGGGRIYLEVRPYVSEIDPTRSVTLNGINVPGLRSRYLETGVELQAGQTLALGGLLQTRTETQNLGIPGLADLPYLGAFFRTTRELQNEVELLITVTPNFAGPMDPHEVPQTAPGINTTNPADKEFYWKGYVEVPNNAANFDPNAASMMTGYPNAYQTMPPAEAGIPMGGQQFDPNQVPNISVGPNAPRLATPPNSGYGPTLMR